MGIKDSDALHKIYEKVKIFCKENNLPYHFKVDDGSYETAIEFFFLGEAKTPQWEVIHPPRSKNWDTDPTILCPDIIDFENRLIIEYEEEGQKRLSGARLARKGHGAQGDIPNSKDSRRNDYYSWGGFRLLSFYEADLKEKNWNKLYNFLK